MAERVSRNEIERRRIDHEVVDLDDGPVGFVLASHRLTIVSPGRDLGDNQTFTTDCLVVDENNYRPMIGEGYKALRDGEEIVLGREHYTDRFHFSDEVSDSHVRIARSGQLITLHDLGSQGGTYLVDVRKENVRMNELAGYTLGKNNNHNEDAYFTNDKSKAFGVFDGVGSQPGSEHAARIAASTIDNYLENTTIRVSRSVGRLAVKNALLAAHEAIISANDSDSRTQTTAVVAKVFETQTGAPYIVVGHSGDSRAYRMRGGVLDHMSLDHTYRMGGWTDGDAMLVQEILSNVTDRANLSERAAVAFRFRNAITSSLGNAQSLPAITVKDYDLRAGDKWLLTSDGVHDNLTTEEIEDTIIASRFDARTATRALVHQAKCRSQDKSHMRSKRDDITAILASFV